KRWQASHDGASRIPFFYVAAQQISSNQTDVARFVQMSRRYGPQRGYLRYGNDILSLSGKHREDFSRMNDTQTRGRRIQVANARPEDSGSGLARIPAAVMQELGLTEGDVVEIIGKRSTPSRAVLSYREDEGLDLLRLDGLQRANAGVGS